MSFVHIIMNLDMSIRDVVGEHRMGLFTRITMKRSEYSEMAMCLT